MTGPLERARAGDIGAFVELVQRYDPELRDLARDEARIEAYVAAFRELPRLERGADPGEWLAAFVRRAADRAGGEEGAGNGGEFWPRLAAQLRAESPALAPPELPERRFPVIPRLQRRRRLQGPRSRGSNN